MLSVTLTRHPVSSLIPAPAVPALERSPKTESAEMQPTPPVMIEPSTDIDHDAVVASGGDYYGWHWLFKCPKCGHPVIHDYEHDWFYPDVRAMSPRVSLASCGDSHPCPPCGFLFVSDDLWAFSNAHWSYADWLLTRAEIDQHGLSHLLKLPSAGTSASTLPK